MNTWQNLGFQQNKILSQEKTPLLNPKVLEFICDIFQMYVFC